MMLLIEPSNHMSQVLLTQRHKITLIAPTNHGQGCVPISYLPKFYPKMGRYYPRVYPILYLPNEFIRWVFTHTHLPSDGYSSGKRLGQFLPDYWAKFGITRQIPNNLGSG